MSDKVEYLPFHAVNEFMRDDYRLAVITEVLSNQEKISPENRSSIGKMMAKGVKVQGFRNSNLAPVGLKAKSSVNLFERSADFAGVVMQAWSELHSELAETTFELLTELGWSDLQPVILDRSKLPGFLIHWPKKDDFEALIKAIRTKKPEMQESDDNLSLMAVWIGNRLPYDLYAEETEEKQE